MKTHKWKDVSKGKLSEEQLTEAEAMIEQAVLEMSLKELRNALGKTQVDIAESTQMKQSELSKVEKRSDHLLSTIRKYVQALGGEVEVFARFPDKSIKLIGV